MLYKSLLMSYPEDYLGTLAVLPGKAWEDLSTYGCRYIHTRRLLGTTDHFIWPLVCRKSPRQCFFWGGCDFYVDQIKLMKFSSECHILGNRIPRNIARCIGWQKIERTFCTIAKCSTNWATNALYSKFPMVLWIGPC